jgi:hypothetical protein
LFWLYTVVTTGILLELICSSFGNTTEVALHLVNTNDKLEELKGLKMESEDLAHDLLRDISITSDVKKAFQNSVTCQKNFNILFSHFVYNLGISDKVCCIPFYPRCFVFIRFLYEVV